MLTKLNIWDLTNYERVIYYDSDHIFLKNPFDAFRLCFKFELCATIDVGCCCCCFCWFLDDVVVVVICVCYC